MNFQAKALSLSVIAAFAVMGCGKEAPPPAHAAPVAAPAAPAAATAATSAAALAKSKNCLSCHAVDKKLVGPSYQDVAKKYAANPAAAKDLATKVRAGGKGIWGEVPMPPNPLVSEQEADVLVAWILAGAK